MAYNRTYYFNFVSDAGISWRLEMYDQVATSAYQNKEGKLGINAGEMKYGSEGSKMFAPLKPSTFSFEFIVTDNASATYIRQLKSARKERDVYVALYRETVTGANSPIYRPYFAGQVLMDLSDDPDIPVPYPITIKAVDGIASLKYYDYLPSTTTQVGSHLYEIGETYIPDPTNVGGQYASWQQCTEIISNCLAYSGEFTTAMGNPTANLIFISARWFNGEMPNTSIDPFHFTRIKPNLFYKKVTQENNTIQYEPKSCYDVLKDICKAWGMRMYYFSGIYYFTQINNFRETETGTQAVPNNIKTFRYNMDGTTNSSSNYINRWWGKYEQPLTNQITTGLYKNHKLGGGKYGLLPAFKRVTIDYLNVDNINSFTSFPLIPIGGTTAPSSAGTYWEFSSLGTYTFDGLTDAVFFQRIYLDVNNNGVNTGNLTIEWVMVARPAGTGSNTANASPQANGWTKYMYTDWSVPTAITNKWSTGMWSLNSGNLPFSNTYAIGIGPQSIDITSGGTAMFPNFPYASTGSNFTAGDWEVGYYVKSPTTGGAFYWSGHGRFAPTGITNPYTSPWQNNVNYTNTAVTSGINASEFAPIISGAVGSAMTTTNLEQTGDDTAYEVVEDIIMGDAGLLSSGGAIQIYTGSAWKNSDISGVWGIDTLAGGNSFSQQLAEDIIKAQAKSIEKFTVSTTIDASETVYYNDGTANRPQWACPFTKFLTLPNASQGMIQKAFIMHTGSFNFLTDTWKWVLYEQASFSISGSTATTTNTGGVNSGITGGGLNSVATAPAVIGQLVMPRTANPVAGLEYQSSLLMRQKVDPVATIRVGSFISRPVEGDPYEQTITSLSITKLSNPVFKTGDKIVLQTQSNELKEIPAEETNPKYNTNRIAFVVSADQVANATTISVTSKTIYQDIFVGDTITFDVENLISQYQNKTEGSIAGFEVDADGLTKDGVEITGWLNSDTMTGATVNNLPTALSVKNYVDNSHPAEDQTLQEVTDNGNTTTNDIIGASLTLGDGTTSESAKVFYSDGQSTEIFGYGIQFSRSTAYLRPTVNNSQDMFLGNQTLGWSILELNAITHIFKNGTAEKMRITSAGNVGIGTTSPTHALQIEDGFTLSAIGFGGTSLKLGNYNSIGYNRIWGDGTNMAYSNSNGYHKWMNQATEQMRITSAGNVGIGTTNPTAKLEVVGQGTGTVKMGSTGFGGDWVGISLSGTLNTSSYNLLSSATNSSFFLNRPIGGDMLFRYNNTDQMIIKASGNVGIGTTAPSSKLEIISGGANGLVLGEDLNNSTLSSRLYLTNGTSGQGVTLLNGGGALKFLTNSIPNNTSGAEKMRITSAGNVGIGTTSPNANLQVEGVTNLSRGNKNLFINPNVSNANIYSSISAGSGMGLALRTNSSAESLRITSAGNVGIGTTSPTAPLHINSATTGEVLKIESTSAPFIRFILGGQDKGFLQFTNTHAYLSNQANGNFYFRTNNTDKMVITSAGNVGIGTTSPSTKLDVAGTGKFTGQITAGYGIKFTNGNTDFLLYNNPSENVLYLRDTTNGAMITTWSVNNFGVNKNLNGTTATFTGQVTIPATPIATTDAASKSYVDAQSSTAMSVFSMLTCTTTTITSASDGVANAVVMKFDTEAITYGPTSSIVSYGNGGITGIENSQFCWMITASLLLRYFEFQWNVTSDTNTVTNRVLSGIRIEEGILEGETLSWSEISPTTSYIYDRGSGNIKKGSTAGSILISMPAGTLKRYYRMVFWKEKASNNSVKSESVLNGTQITLKQLK
jgi:hypothetical protein